MVAFGSPVVDLSSCHSFGVTLCISIEGLRVHDET
jgi:hypothetical protein